MSDDFFKLAKDLVRTTYPQPKAVKYYCVECCQEYSEPLNKCTKIIEPETEDLFALLCEGKIKQVGDS